MDVKANHIKYDFDKSLARIDSILDAEDAAFEELKTIPSRDRLSYTNGFYVKCAALFVDIRGSSSLPDEHRRPTLAKLYRAYLSEVVAVINGDANCAEINIVGDCVSGIFDTPYKADIQQVFGTGSKVATIVRALNVKLKKAKISEIEIGIGMDYGRALMIQAGYSGSGINEVVWMGDVVNRASKLCSLGNGNGGHGRTVVSPVFYNNLTEHQRGLLSYDGDEDVYHGWVISKDMEAWVTANS